MALGDVYVFKGFGDAAKLEVSLNMTLFKKQ